MAMKIPTLRLHIHSPMQATKAIGVFHTKKIVQKRKKRINNNPLHLTPIVDISSDNIDYGIASHVV